MSLASSFAALVAPSDRPRLAPLPASRPDLRIIADLVTPGTRVLDIGCGDGLLLAHLGEAKGVDGRGIELSEAGVNACVRHGLSVIQGDADTDLAHYPTGAFDYVILSLTLQATRDPKRVLGELVRIGRHAIVSIPNFGHWRVRWHLLTRGRMPKTKALRHEWYDTPNIHLCTITDFIALADALGVEIECVMVLDGRGRTLRAPRLDTLVNLLAEQAIFVLKRR